MALTLGSIGEKGRPFLLDIQQAESSSILNALLGGTVFNLANILLTAAIASAGMAVAFPIGIGLALILGVIINYVLVAKGNVLLLSIGVVLVTIAIIVNAVAYKRHNAHNKQPNSAKWIIVALIAGVMMSTFYPFVASSMDLDNFTAPQIGKMTPYTAFFVFSIGIFSSNFLFNSLLMKRPLEGPPITYDQFFRGSFYNHIIGMAGGIIWGVGNLFNLIAAGKAGPAISYGLGQGATLVAAFWGVFIWREFKGSSPTINRLIILMFACFIIGLSFIIAAGN